MLAYSRDHQEAAPVDRWLRSFRALAQGGDPVGEAYRHLRLCHMDDRPFIDNAATAFFLLRTEQGG